MEGAVSAARRIPLSSSAAIPRPYSLLLDGLGPVLPLLAKNRRDALHFVCDSLEVTRDPQIARALGRRLGEGRPRWDRVLRLAQEHFLVPSLWAALRDRGLLRPLPEPLRRHVATRTGRGLPIEMLLEDRYRENRERNEGLRRQAREAIEKLNSIGIEPVLVKGAAWLFAEGIEIGERFQRDLDLFLPETAVDDAARALAGAGYSPARTEESPEGYRSLGWYRTSHHHYCPLVKPGEPGPIELHWALGPPEVSRVLPPESAMREARPLPLGGPRAQTLSATHEVLLGILHGQLADRQHRRAFLPLRHLLDLARMHQRLGARIRWDDLRDALAAHDLVPLAEDSIALAHLLLRMPRPAAFPDAPRSRRHASRCVTNACLPEALRKAALAARSVLWRRPGRGL